MADISKIKLLNNVTYDIKDANATYAIDIILSDIAETYDPTATYAVGDCVIYDKVLYQCTTAITTPEAWDPTHWVAVKAVDVGSGGEGGYATAIEMSSSNNTTVYDAITDTSEANALNHLGFYLDENGGLCQVNEI